MIDHRKIFSWSGIFQAHITKSEEYQVYREHPSDIFSKLFIHSGRIFTISIPHAVQYQSYIELIVILISHSMNQNSTKIQNHNWDVPYLIRVSMYMTAKYFVSKLVVDSDSLEYLAVCWINIKEIVER